MADKKYNFIVPDDYKFDEYTFEDTYIGTFDQAAKEPSKSTHTIMPIPDDVELVMPEFKYYPILKAINPYMMQNLLASSMGWMSRDEPPDSTQANKELIATFQPMKAEFIGSGVDKHPLHTGIGYEHGKQSEVPDCVMPLTGYRAWQVEGRSQLLSLAMYIPDTLNPGTATPAICQPFGFQPVHGQSDSPFAECSCGYYSFKTIESLANELTEGIERFRYIIGICDVWGKVIEHEYGYRSQYIYPRELWITKPEQEYLSEMYGVPIRKSY